MASVKKFILTLFGFGLLLTACGKTTNEDLVGEAQYCLDGIDAANISSRTDRQTQVDACLSKISSLSTQQAQLMKCSGNFLIEGFGSVSKINSAMDALSQSSGGSAPMSLLSAVAFSDSSFASETLSYCQAAGSPSFTMIASMAQIATVMSDVGINLSSGTLSPADVTNIMNNGNPEAIGTAAQAAYATSCTNGAQVDEALCSQFSGIISANGGNQEAIGQALLDAWKTP